MTFAGWVLNGGSLTGRGPLGGVYIYVYGELNASSVSAPERKQEEREEGKKDGRKTKIHKKERKRDES